MEKLEIETEVDSRLISEMTERAFNVSPEYMRASQNLDNDVAVIILKVHNPAFATTARSYDIKIWGRTAPEWLSLAFDTCPITQVECGMEADILSVVKPHLTDKAYTAVFYADTPLITRKTFLSIMDYVKTKRMNVAKLKRGYVFVTDYVKNATNIYATQSIYCDETDFVPMYNLSDLAVVTDVLHNRIIDFHRESGVLIVDAASTFIDADVVIGKNVTIYPNNTISGLSVLTDSITLNPGNIIINSKIDANSVLTASVVENSELKPNTVLAPFTHVLGGKVQGGTKK